MTSQVGGLPLSCPHNAELRLRYLHWPSFVNREIRPREAGNTEYQLSRAWGVWIFIPRQPSLAHTGGKTQIVSSQEWGVFCWICISLIRVDPAMILKPGNNLPGSSCQLTSAQYSISPPTLPSSVQQNRSDERLGVRGAPSDPSPSCNEALSEESPIIQMQARVTIYKAWFLVNSEHDKLSIKNKAD